MTMKTKVKSGKSSFQLRYTISLEHLDSQMVPFGESTRDIQLDTAKSFSEDQLSTFRKLKMTILEFKLWFLQVFVLIVLSLTFFSSYQTWNKYNISKKSLQKYQLFIPDRPNPQFYAQNYYFFSDSTKNVILNSGLQQLYQKNRKNFDISKQQHIRAVIWTQLVHNINFKGEVQIELTAYDQSLQKKRRAIQLILEEQNLYYEENYDISKYEDTQLRFCLVVPSYNNAQNKLYLRNLDSIFMQDYHNYHVVYIDDYSPDKTGHYVQEYIKQKNIPHQKIHVILNSQNKKALYNIYNGIHRYCPDGQIVALIDGDDSLIGRKVFKLYNAVFQKKKSALIYSNFLKIVTNNSTSYGFGKAITPEYFYENQLRLDWNLVGTHFMAFYSDLFKKIRIQDLIYQNGTFFNYAYDRAIITPMIQMAFPRVQYITQMTYEYRNDTGVNDGTQDWERVSRIIQQDHQPYHSLGYFPFIQNQEVFKNQGLKQHQKNALSAQKQQEQKTKMSHQKLQLYAIDSQQHVKKQFL